MEVAPLQRKPEAAKVDLEVRYLGFDIPQVFVVGYGLDHAEDYRSLPFIGTLARTCTRGRAAWHPPGLPRGRRDEAA